MTILILGEGNFSYACSLVSKTLSDGDLPLDLIATSYDDYDLCVKKYGSVFIDNIQFLRSNNINVLFRIDATRLQHNLQTSLKYLPTLERIIFNFPHIGKKAGIHKNRY